MHYHPNSVNHMLGAEPLSVFLIQKLTAEKFLALFYFFQNFDNENFYVVGEPHKFFKRLALLVCALCS